MRFDHSPSSSYGNFQCDLALQALNPFYLFQAYTVILWSVQFYWKFAVVIAITSVIAVTVSVWETRRVSKAWIPPGRFDIFP